MRSGTHLHAPGKMAVASGHAIYAHETSQILISLTGQWHEERNLLHLCKPVDGFPCSHK